ncbi:MAG TPA: PqqD family protein [Pyrinomonadaceae bacterium]|nr:PqqD family protein [Pyrinomonadaceae bacterium]
MNSKARIAKPIARKQGLVIQELPDEVLVYDLERDRAHCLNETAAFVWQRCDGQNSTTQIARTLGDQLNCEVDEKIIWLALDQLGRSYLLEKQPTAPPAMKGMNRRTMMRSLGIAVTVPLVISITAPTVQAASSCIGSGSPCTPGGIPCCANLSCSGPAGQQTCQ